MIDALNYDGAPDFRLGTAAARSAAQRAMPAVFYADGKILVHHKGRQTEVEVVDALEASLAPQNAGNGALRSPMYGKLAALLVAAGARVVKGQRLAVVEAMKMEHALLAPFDGIAAEVTGVEGQQIAQGAVIALIVADAETETLA